MENPAVAGPFVAAWLALSLVCGSPVRAQHDAAVAETIVVEGRVVDMRGEPVPVARIEVATSKDRDRPVARTVADGEGCFRIGKIPAHDRIYITARAEGYCVGNDSIRPNQRIVAITLHHATTVRGRLHNRKGEPVAGATVRAHPTGRALFDANSDAVTTADGSFVLTDVPLAPVEVAAWVPGEGLARQRTTASGPLELTLTPEVAPTTRIDVTVEGLAADDAPLGLTLLPYTQGSLNRLPPPHDRPQMRNGTWSLDLAPDWDYTVYPTSMDWAFAPRSLEVKSGTGPHSMKFTATRIGSSTLTIQARVRGPDDAPVAGVALVLRAPNGGNEAHATSSADGTCSFASPLSKGVAAVVRAQHPDWCMDQPTKGELEAMERRRIGLHTFQIDPNQTIDLRVIPACKVKARLLHADRRPAALVSVMLEESSTNRWPKWMHWTSATTDRDGCVTFHGLHHMLEDVRLFVEGTAGSAIGEPFRLDEAGKNVDLGVVLMQPPASIEGVVRDARQKPAPGVRVWLRDWDLGNGQQASGSVTETLTDRDGRYRFLGAPPGGAYLQLLTSADERAVSAKAVEPFEVEPGKTYTHDLTLPEK